MMHFLRPLLGVLLSALIVATSASLAAARGQTHVAGQVVLCIGSVATTVSVDEKGQPAAPPHICPDCALMVLVGDATPPELPQDPETVGRRIALSAEQRHKGLRLFTPGARGPPVRV